MHEMYWTSLDFLNDLIEQIPAGIFWKDNNSVFLGCNHFFARLADIKNPKDIIGKTDYDLPWAQYQAQFYIADDQEVIQSQKPKLGIEEYLTLADGSECVLLTNKIPLFDKTGHVVGILGIFHDITRRKNMEMQLEQEKNRAQMANNAKTEFITNMSHDIRTPLTGVISLSHYLYEKLYDENAKQFAQWIFESGQQLLSLLNSILDLVSSDNLQEGDICYEAFDLAQLINDIIKMHKPTFVTKNLDFELDFDASLQLTVLGDRSKIFRTLLNLLSNAIKFTSQGKIILRVSCLEKTDTQVKLEFRVIDSGIGIPFDLQSKVFDRFYKAHPSYMGVYKGHGLGLHIAKTYVELMGGTIYLESTPGSGAQFYFHITMDLIMNERIQSTTQLEPIKLAANDLSEEIVQKSSNLKSSIQLMLVEDNKIARKMVEIFCQQLGYDLDCFESVQQALQAYDQKHYDLVITDIGLPEQSGYDLAKIIRTNEAETGAIPVPIIGLTAHAHFSVKNNCLNAGMQDVLHKPMSLELLSSTVTAYCNHISQIQSMADSSADVKFYLNYQYYEKFNLFNLEKAISRIQSQSTLKEMIMMFLHQDLEPNLDSANYAFEQRQYGSLQDIAHKIRGGSVYCCTERLHRVSESLENVLVNQEDIDIKTLFPVWSYVLYQTIQELRHWLTKEH